MSKRLDKLRFTTKEDFQRYVKRLEEAGIENPSGQAMNNVRHLRENSFYKHLEVSGKYEAIAIVVGLIAALSLFISLYLLRK